MSVIIPTYNMAQFLPEAIESVLGQSFRDFELIIVDDGSTDSTVQAVAQFARQVRYFWQENAGVSAALNLGNEVAHGQYICFLGADDALAKEALEKGAGMLDRYPEAAFSFGQVCYMDEHGKDLGMLRQWPQQAGLMAGREVLLELLGLRFILPSAAFIRRACFREIGGFDQGLGYGEDTELFVRLAKRWSAIYIAEPLARRRKHLAAITAQIDLERQEQAWLKILEEAAEPPAFGLGRQRLTFYVYSALARQAYGHEMGKARHYMIKALRAGWPWLTSKEGLAIIYLFAKLLLPHSAIVLAGNLKQLLSGG